MPPPSSSGRPTSAGSSGWRGPVSGALSGRMADEEDVALSAFESFYRRAEQGQFPQLEDRDDLWQLLFVLTVRKAINLVNYQGRKSRGGGRVQSLTDLDLAGR